MGFDDYLTICEAEVYGSSVDDADICTDHLLPIGTVVAPPESSAKSWKDYTASVKVQVPVEGAVGMLVRHQVHAAPMNTSSPYQSAAVRALMARAKMHESFDCPNMDHTVTRQDYRYTTPSAAIADAVGSGRTPLSGAKFEWSANLSPKHDVSSSTTPKGLFVGGAQPANEEIDLSVVDGYTNSDGANFEWVSDAPAGSTETRSLEMTKTQEGNKYNNWIGSYITTKLGDAVKLKYSLKFVSAVPLCNNSALGTKKHKGSGPGEDCSWMAKCTTNMWCSVEREWLEDDPSPTASLVIFTLDRAPQNTRVRIADVSLQTRSQPLAVLGRVQFGQGAAGTLFSSGHHGTTSASAAAAASPAQCTADGIIGQALRFEERSREGWHAVTFTPPLPVLPKPSFRGHFKFASTADLDLANVAAAYNAGGGTIQVGGTTFKAIETAAVAFTARYIYPTWAGVPTQYSGNATHGLNALMWSMRHDGTISMRIGGLKAGRGYKLQLLLYERGGREPISLDINREYRGMIDPWAVQEQEKDSGGTIFETGVSATCRGEVLVELGRLGSSPIFNGVVVNDLPDSDQAAEYSDGTCEAEGALEVGKSNYTVSVWVYPEAVGNDARTIVTKGNDHSTWRGWSIYTSNGRVHLRGKATSQSGGQRWMLSLTHQLLPRQWSHIAMVISRDGEETRLRGYINSELSGERMLPAGIDVIARHGAHLTVGRASARYNQAFIGRVDELAVWQDALSSADISALYSAGCAHQSLPTTAPSPPPSKWHDRVLLANKGHTCGSGCSGENNAWLPVSQAEYRWPREWAGPKHDNWTSSAFSGAGNESAYVYIGGGCCTGASAGYSTEQYPRFWSSRTACKESCDADPACVAFQVASASDCADEDGRGECNDITKCTHHTGIASANTGIALKSSCDNTRCYAKSVASWRFGTVGECKSTCAHHATKCGGFQHISNGLGACGPDADETACDKPGACYFRQDPTESICPTPAPTASSSCHVHSTFSLSTSALTRKCLPLERLAPDDQLKSLAAASPAIPTRQRRSFYRVTLGCSLASESDNSADCLQLAAQSYEGTVRVLEARRAPKGLLRRGEWYTLATEVSTNGSTTEVRVSLDGQLLFSTKDEHPVADEDSVDLWSLHRGGVAVFSAGANKAAFDDLSVRFPISALDSSTGEIEVRSDDGDAGVSIGTCSSGCIYSFSTNTTPQLLNRTLNDAERTISLVASGVPYADASLIHVTVGGIDCPIVAGSLRLLAEAEGGAAGTNTSYLTCTPAHTSLGAGTHTIGLSVEGQGPAYGAQLRADGRELVFEVELRASANKTTGSVAGGQEMAVEGMGMATAADAGNISDSGGAGGSTSTSLLICGVQVEQRSARGDSALETLVVRAGSLLPAAVVADESALGLTEGSSSDSGAGVIFGAVQATKAKIKSRADNAIEDTSTGVVNQRPNGWRFLLTSSPNHLSAVRFRGDQLRLPPAVRVTDAHAVFRSYGRSTGPLHLRIWAEASSSAADFGVHKKERQYDLSSRNKTKASVVWSPEDWRGSGEEHSSMDLSPLLNELVERKDWTANSAVVLIFRMEGVVGKGVLTPRVAVSWDGFAGQYAAELRVVYREVQPVDAAAKDCGVSVRVTSPSAYHGSGGCSAKDSGTINLLALDGVKVNAATNAGGTSGTVWLQLAARSAGLLVGNRASLRVNNQIFADGPERGFHVVVIDGTNVKVVVDQSFDTHWLIKDAERLGKLLSERKKGDIIMLAAKDEASNQVRTTPRLMEALRTLGAPGYGIGPSYRGSYALIARVGFPSETALSVSRDSEAVVERIFACGETASTLSTAQAFAAVGSGSRRGKSLVAGACAVCAAGSAYGSGDDLWSDDAATTCGSCGESNHIYGVGSSGENRWMLGTVEQCKTKCIEAATQCGGFNYINTSSHSCGLNLDDTKCELPGACYFRRSTGCAWGTDKTRACHTLRRFPSRGSSASSFPCVDAHGHCSGPTAGSVSCPAGFWRCANADTVATSSSSADLPRSTSAHIFRRTGFRKWPQKSVFKAIAKARIARMERATDRRAIDGTSSFWLAVGSPDATLTFELGQLVTVQRIEIDWAAAPRRLLVLSKVSGEARWTKLLSKRRKRGLRALRYSLVQSEGGGGGVPMTGVRLYMDDAVALTPSSANMGRNSPFIGVAEVRLLGCGRQVQKLVTEEEISSRRRLGSVPRPLFSYSLAATPNVTSVSPARGSTAGGTRITITGTGLQATEAAEERRRLSSTTPGAAEVKIAGKVCNVTSVTPTAIECTTGYHGVTGTTGPGHATVEVWVPGNGYAVPASAAAARYHYIDLWSRHTTWGGGPLPRENELVSIPPANNVLLDMSPPKLSVLIVEGKLSFDRVDGLTLNASYILVLRGTFEVGTEADPFLQKATITLHGGPKSVDLPIYGAKVLACRECTLDLHGRFHHVTWTRLSATAAKGATSLSLQQSVDWAVGSKIIVTSTHWDRTQVEERFVSAITDEGKTIRLTAALEHLHLGETRTFDGQDVELRAEVGLLTRNVLVQGDEMSVEPVQYGGTIMLHSAGDESLIGRIEGIEATRMGQAYRLGRYPIHFHMIGDVTKSYARRNSVHRTFNRAFTIHGVHKLRVQFNVAYNTMGHTYFIEDAIETKNIIEYNLAALTRASNALLNTDQTPTSFWITNPDNHVRHNTGAGSKNYGFWYRAETHVTGVSASEGLGDDVCPKGIPLLEFYNNTAHSNGRYGFRVYDEYFPRVNPCDSKSQLVEAKFQKLLAYRNSVNGAQISAVGAQVYDGFKMVDNVHAGFEMPGAQGGLIKGAWGANQIVNSLIVGKSGDDMNITELKCGGHGNFGTGGKSAASCSGLWKPVLGIEAPSWHRLTVSNTTFANFHEKTDGRTVAVGALAKEGFTPSGGGWETKFEKIRWENAPQRTWFEHKHEAIFTDVDGTFSETGIPQTTIAPYNELMPHFPECVLDARYNIGYGGRVCKNSTWRRISINQMAPDQMEFKYLLVGFIGDGKSPFVKADDTAYLKGKWRAIGDDHLIVLNISTTAEFGAINASVYPVPRGGSGGLVLTSRPINRQGLWREAQGMVVPASPSDTVVTSGVHAGAAVTLIVTEHDKTITNHTGVVSADGSQIVWGCDFPTNARWLCAPNWVSCDADPAKCVAPGRYGVPRHPIPHTKVEYSLKRRTKKNGYEFTVPTGRLYDVRWWMNENDNADIGKYRFDVSDLQGDDHLWIRHQYQQVPDHFQVEDKGESLYSFDKTTGYVSNMVVSAACQSVLDAKCNNNLFCPLYPAKQLVARYFNGFQDTGVAQRHWSCMPVSTADGDANKAKWESGDYKLTDNVTVCSRQGALRKLLVGCAGNTFPQSPAVDDEVSFGDWHFDTNTLSATYLVRAPTVPLHAEDEFVDAEFKAWPCPDIPCGCKCDATEDVELSMRSWGWSQASGWAQTVHSSTYTDSAGLPGVGNDVEIPNAASVLLDMSPPVLNEITVLGSLVFEDARDVRLQAVTILIRGGGSLRVGNDTAPFKHIAEIILHGDRSTPGLKLNANDYGAKVLAVFGTLQLRGKPRVSWTQLDSSATSGSSTVRIRGAVDWVAGDEIVLAPTDYDAQHAEKRAIMTVSISGTGDSAVTTATVNEPLVYTHYAGVETHGAHTVDTRGEVGLLTRNVVVRGGDTDLAPQYRSLYEQEFGATVLVGRYTYFSGASAKGTTETGQAFVDNVEFADAGHAALDDRDAIRFVGLGASSGSYLTNSAFNWVYNTAVSVKGCEGLQLSGNVVYHSVGSTFKIFSAGNVLRKNLVVHTVSETTYRRAGDRSYLRFIPWEDYVAAFEVTKKNFLDDNVAAGSERLGFKLHLPSCADSDSDMSFNGNLAHSTMIGLGSRGTCHASCARLENFKAYKNWDYGIWGNVPCSTHFKNVQLVDNKVGMLYGLFGPPSAAHTYTDSQLTVENSLFLGSSSNADCTAPKPPMHDVYAWSIDKSDVGFACTSFASGLSGGIPVKKPWHKLMTSYAALWGETRFNGVAFANYDLDSCGRRSHAFETNAAVPDAFMPFIFENVAWSNVPLDSKFFIHKPIAAWIALDDCVTMDCDGPKHMLLIDKDGTLTGAGAGSTIIAKAEYFAAESYGWKPPGTVPGKSSNGAPQKLLTTWQGVSRAQEDVIKRYGVPREGCTDRAEWNAWLCPASTGLKHRRLVIESMDGDTEERSLVPVALTDVQKGTTDLMNGGQDHGWCFGYTCLKRLSAFHSTVALGKRYQLDFSGTNPGHLRYHLRAEAADESIILSMYYANPQRLQVYVDDQPIEDANYQDGKHVGGCKTAETNDGWVDTPLTCPTLSDSTGFNSYNRTTHEIHLVIRGDTVVEVRTLPVVLVSMDLAISITDFYAEEANIVGNIAFVLGIPSSRIRVVDIVAGTDRRRQLASAAVQESKKTRKLKSGTSGTSFTFEIGPDTCADGVRNTNVSETDVDCGGPCVRGETELCASYNVTCTMSKCGVGKRCVAGSDCESSVCALPTSAPTSVPTPAPTFESAATSDSSEAGTSTSDDSEAAKAAAADDADASAPTPAPEKVYVYGYCAAPSCTDGVKNGDEADVDCGASCTASQLCGTNQFCTDAADCGTKVCGSSSRCLAPTCSDGAHNGDEGDTDCGGSCATCAFGRSCKLGTDCRGGVCSDGVCQLASCSDGVRNGLELGIDCGAVACGGAAVCSVGAECAFSTDCASQVCTDGKCAVPTCADGVRNGNETAVDCGDFQGVCVSCEDYDSCAVDGLRAENCGCTRANQCASKSCSGGKCVVPTCSDGIANQGETDIDCGSDVECGGGTTSTPCASGCRCVAGVNCASGVCIDQKCIARSCSDGVKNGDEKDVDCGGSCGACAPGMQCVDSDADCKSQICSDISNRCEAPSCSDFVKNGGETDIDCGGQCDGCAVGKSCASHSDCVSGFSCSSAKKCEETSSSSASKTDLEDLADKVSGTDTTGALATRLNTTVSTEVAFQAQKPTMATTGGRVGTVIASLSSSSSSANGFSLWYTTGTESSPPSDPKCPLGSVAGVGQLYAASSKPSFDEGMRVRAVACGTNLQQSEELSASVSVEAYSPVASLESLPSSPQAVQVTLSSASAGTANFEIYYTTSDGVEPSCPHPGSYITGSAITAGNDNSTRYSAPLVASARDGGFVIKAIACGASLHPSTVASAIVAVPSEKPTISTTGTFPKKLTFAISTSEEGGSDVTIVYTLGASEWPSCPTGSGVASTHITPAVGMVLVPGPTAPAVELREPTHVRAITCGTYLQPSAVAEQFVHVFANCEVSAWSAWGNCLKEDRRTPARCAGGWEQRTRSVTFEPTTNGQQCPALWSQQLCNSAPCVRVTMLLQNETKTSFAAKQQLFMRGFAAALGVAADSVAVIANLAGSGGSGSSVHVELSIASTSNAQADILIASIRATGFDQQVVNALRGADYPGAETMTAASVQVESVAKDVSPDHKDATAAAATAASGHQAQANVVAIVVGVMAGLLFMVFLVYFGRKWWNSHDFTAGGARKVTKKGSTSVDSKWAEHSLDRHTEANASSLQFDSKGTSMNPLHANGDLDEIADVDASIEDSVDFNADEGGIDNVRLPGTMADGSGRGIRTESVQSAVDPSSGKMYFYNTHTQKTGWSADEVSRKGVNDSYGLGRESGEGMAFSGHNPLARGGGDGSKNGAKKDKKGKKESSEGANLNSGDLPRTASVAEAHDPATGKPYYYNLHTQKTGWSADEVSRKGVNDSYGLSRAESVKGGRVSNVESEFNLSNPMHVARTQKGIQRVDSNLVNKHPSSEC
jgi:hypothetical protein